MIELYTVKLNNDYTYYSNADASSPTTGDTLLADVTDVTFTRGYSYSYNGVDWDRIEVKEDNKTKILPTINNICKSLNNYFFVKGSGVSVNSDLCVCSRGYRRGYIYLYDGSMDYSGSDITVSSNITIPFISGDLIYIDDSDRNSQKFGYISNIAGQTITLNRDLVEDSGRGLLMLSYIPEDVEEIMSKMIWFDTYQREILQSGKIERETEDNYSVSYKLDGMSIGNINYPSGITNGLKPYQLLRMI